MPEGEFDMALSSPPYAESLGNTKSDIDWSKQADRETSHSHGYDGEGYGVTEGQLAAMPEGKFDGAISSSPWESVGNFDESVRKIDESASIISSRKNAGVIEKSYGNTSGQLGQESGSTFWQAARIILEQTYQVLAPGAHAIFVVKAFVRKKKLVDFPGQWQALCESVGFVTLHKHRAWLVEDRGSQHTIFGEIEHRSVERKSFFRRLAERKGSPRIDWETVLCTVKPKNH